LFADHFPNPDDTLFSPMSPQPFYLPNILSSIFWLLSLVIGQKESNAVMGGNSPCHHGQGVFVSMDVELGLRCDTLLSRAHHRCQGGGYVGFWMPLVTVRGVLL
jgi:hypothetical protein